MRTLSEANAPKLRIVLIVAVVVVFVLVFSVAYLVRLGPTSSQTSVNTTFATNFSWYISVNYSGSWNLVYWGQNGTYGSQENLIPGQTTYTYNVKGDLNGSGNTMTTVVTYGAGYVENTLCAQATRLDSRGLTLTLTVLGPPHNDSTTASNPSVEVCATYAV